MVNEKLRIVDIEQHVTRDGYSSYDSDECRLCGRAMSKVDFHIHEVDGGGVALHTGDEDKYVDDGGNLGFQPIGSTCASKIPKGYLHGRDD